MPNRLTAVPDGPVPPLGRLASALVPLADLFMLAMVSRPAGGSLRHVWVTPATLGLGAAGALAGVALLVLGLVALGGVAAWLALGGGALLAAGAAAVVSVGAAQRR